MNVVAFATAARASIETHSKLEAVGGRAAEVLPIEIVHDGTPGGVLHHREDFVVIGINDDLDEVHNSVRTRGMHG